MNSVSSVVLIWKKNYSDNSAFEKGNKEMWEVTSLLRMKGTKNFSIFMHVMIDVDNKYSEKSDLEKGNTKVGGEKFCALFI